MELSYVLIYLCSFFLFFYPLFLHFLVTFLISFCYMYLPVSVVTHDVTRQPLFDLQSERYKGVLRSMRKLHCFALQTRLIWPHCFHRWLDEERRENRRRWGEKGRSWGGRKRIILLQNSKAPPVRTTDTGRMEVKTFRWLEVETGSAGFWFSEFMSN
jgi:hypothetical protein